jgi:pimeloyl-ACP methyl ester carboxylesterase
MAFGAKFDVAVDGTVLVGERWRADGPAVLFLHSGVTDRRAWYAVIDRLDDKIDAVAFDQRGHGRSPLGDRAFRRVDDAIAVLDDQKIERALLVGNSLGGGVALDLALIAPDRVVGLVLLATATSGAPQVEDDRVDPATLVLSQRIDRAFEDGDKDERVRLETWLWLDGPAQPEGRVVGAPRRLAEEMGRAITEDEVLNGKSGLPAWDRIEEITTPAIVAVGEYDIPILNERCRILADRLPNSSYRVLKGTAHGPSLDVPDLVVDLIRELLPGVA